MHSITNAGIVLMVSLGVLASACKKDKPAGDSGPSAPCGQFEGIFRRDINGVQIPMQPDTTDWLTTDEWCAEVEALFLPALGITWAGEDSSIWVGAFPNPAEDEFMFVCVRDSASFVDLRVVRENLQPLFQLDSMWAHRIVFDLDAFSVVPGEMVRVYYRIVHPDGTSNRGHGDVQRMP
ncbi:MAG: hypothetical protein WAT74_11835 [Flavobacteriales bacterium]